MLVRIDHVIWATADLDAAAERLEREHGLRAGGGGRHDGMGTHNRIVAMAEAMAEPTLPFFIERGRDVPDPSAGGDAGGITWIEVAGDESRLARWLDGAELPVRVRPGVPALLAVGIGEQELR